MVVVMVVVVAAAAVVFCANREVSSGFFPSFLWYPPVLREGERERRGMEGGVEERGGRRIPQPCECEKESATSSSRKKKDKAMKGGRERERNSNRFVPSSWPGTQRRGLVARLLVRSMSPLSSSLFPSLCLPYPRVPPPFLSSSPRARLFLSLLLLAPRSLSSLPPTSSSRSRAASRTHETRVPAKSLCHLANARPRRGVYPAPCAIAKNQLIVPPRLSSSSSSSTKSRMARYGIADQR